MRWFKPMYTQKEINSLANRIAKAFNPSQIFLFGSYAFGTPTSDSDIDLCVVTDLGGKRKPDLIREISREIYAVFHGSLDILLYGKDEFAQRASLKNTLEYKISNEGKLLT